MTPDPIPNTAEKKKRPSIAPLRKELRRMVSINNGGPADRQHWVVTLHNSIKPYVSFRLPGRHTVYTLSLAVVLDYAEKKAADELVAARRAARTARRAVRS